MSNKVLLASKRPSVATGSLLDLLEELGIETADYHAYPETDSDGIDRFIERSKDELLLSGRGSTPTQSAGHTNEINSLANLLLSKTRV